jgi:uncharacterized membrane protein
MQGKALLAFVIAASLAVVAFNMHHKHPEQVSMAPTLVLGAIALLGLIVAMRSDTISPCQRERDRAGLRNVCGACG